VDTGHSYGPLFFLFENKKKTLNEKIGWKKNENKKIFGTIFDGEAYANF